METKQDTKSFSSFLLTFIASFVSAVCVSSFVFVPPLVAVFVLLVGFTVFVVEKILFGSVRKEISFVIIVLLAFSLGALRYAVKDFHELNYRFESRVGETVSLEGLVVTEPELRDNSTRFILKTDGEKVLVSVGLYTEVLYGDVIKVEGKLGKPGIIDPSTSSGQATGRPFDYGAYLAKDDIYYTMSFANEEILRRGEGNFLKQKLFALKRTLVSQMKEILPEPESSLLAGLVVSGREAMPQGVLEEFRRAGVIHIVVLSGYNVAIIADFMRKSLEKFFLISRLPLSLGFATGFSVLGILLFVIMTGAEATVVRASIMVLTVILAKSLGRNYSAPRALLLAGFLMIVWNPKILIFDPSFQLSFLATLALIYIVPIFEKFFSFISDKFGLRSVVSTTSATQLMVLPLLVYSMGDFSLVSLLANVLVLSLIPLTMLFGFIATLVSFVSTLLAWPLSYIAHLFLFWILSVSSLLGNLPFASIGVPKFPLWVLLLVYLGVIVFIKFYKKSSDTNEVESRNGFL